MDTSTSVVLRGSIGDCKFRAPTLLLRSHQLYHEVAAYYVVAEALTNAAKHARASTVRVAAHIDDERLCLQIQDDGVGGVDPRKGSGLIGLTDRVEALGGRMQVVSPPGNGTSLDITIPIDLKFSDRVP